MKRNCLGHAPFWWKRFTVELQPTFNIQDIHESQSKVRTVVYQYSQCSKTKQISLVHIWLELISCDASERIDEVVKESGTKFVT